MIGVRSDLYRFTVQDNPMGKSQKSSTGCNSGVIKD